METHESPYQGVARPLDASRAASFAVFHVLQAQARAGYERQCVGGGGCAGVVLLCSLWLCSLWLCSGAVVLWLCSGAEVLARGRHAPLAHIHVVVPVLQPIAHPISLLRIIFRLCAALQM